MEAETINSPLDTDHLEKTITVDGKKCHLMIYDTQGQEGYVFPFLPFATATSFPLFYFTFIVECRIDSPLSSLSTFSFRLFVESTS